MFLSLVVFILGLMSKSLLMAAGGNTRFYYDLHQAFDKITTEMNGCDAKISKQIVLHSSANVSCVVCPMGRFGQRWVVQLKLRFYDERSPSNGVESISLLSHYGGDSKTEALIIYIVTASHQRFRLAFL